MHNKQLRGRRSTASKDITIVWLRLFPCFTPINKEQTNTRHELLHCPEDYKNDHPRRARKLPRYYTKSWLISFKLKAVTVERPAGCTSRKRLTQTLEHQSKPNVPALLCRTTTARRVQFVHLRLTARWQQNCSPQAVKTVDSIQTEAIHKIAYCIKSAQVHVDAYYLPLTANLTALLRSFIFHHLSALACFLAISIRRWISTVPASS